MIAPESKIKKAISRTATIGIVVVVIIVIAIGGYYVSTTGPSSTTSTTTSSISSVPTTTSSLTTSSVTTVSTTTSSSILQTTTSTTSTTSSYSAPKTLVIDDASWPFGDLNPLGTGTFPNWFQFTEYQPLVSINDTLEYSTGAVQYLPGLAQSWNVSSNGMTYTFNLRHGITFSNGDPFNAYQIWLMAYANYYLLGNSSGWLLSYTVFNYSNVNFGAATISLINQTGGVLNPTGQGLAAMENTNWPIYVTGPYQIVFQLAAPFNYFPALLINFGIADMQYALNHGGFGTAAAPNTYFELNALPGTGPYMVTGISPQAYVEFTQNPTYWGRNMTSAQIQADVLLDPGHVANVVVNYKSDDLARYTDVSTGTAQIAAIEAADWNLITSNPTKFSYTVMPPWAMFVSFMALNTDLYPTNNTDFRLAVVHAINYTDIISKAFLGEATPFVGPEYPAYTQFYDLSKSPGYSYNTTLASQYLAESNVPSGTTITFRTLSGCEYCSIIGQIVQADLGQIGINVNILIVPSGTFANPYGSYQTDLQDTAQLGNLALIGSTGAWAPDALTPADNWVSFVSNESFFGNFANYYNPIVQDCVNAFTSTTNVAQIQALCTQAQTQIDNDAPYAWLGVLRLWDIDGSLVWQKGVVNSFALDPVFSGETTIPMFNTVTFG